MPARRTVERISALTALIIFAYFVLIQLLVIVGAVPVSILWGGSHEELTWQLRLASLFGALILAGFARVVYKRAEHVLKGDETHGEVRSSTPSKAYRILSWVVTTYIALNTAGNFASKTVYERYVSGTLALVLTSACAIVSSSNVQQDEYEPL